LADRTRIDAAELVGVRLSSDGTRLLLILRDQAGQTVSLSLPANCLNTVLTALPRQVETGTVHQLDTWNMVTAENDRDLVLTLRTPEGLAISFMTKPWQVQGMATLATYSHPHQVTKKSIH